MKYWVDPPEGWRWGFPKVWDEEVDGTMEEFLKKNNYPDVDASWIRMWEYKEDNGES